ncbi:hypothetical protein NDN08_006447 [Rhodosorus marinus]|uniref:Mediator of RNA polymerase II transcription subunit 17 n=1 Tax=Rhodosorus marinus TaxID=101924 RepID=A0AAV8UHN2_9RHOD|nr:hypothetical protein NDN08_006447 [Rhodosorus marinus]
MNIEAELEARLDGLDVSEVLADGTFIPDPGAREALGSLHALRVVSHASEVSELKGDAGELRKWCTKSIESLDATAFETSRIMDAVAAIRSTQMGFLAVKKVENRKEYEESIDIGVIRAKRKLLKHAANILKQQARILKEWAPKESEFVSCILAVRRTCGGIGRESKKGDPIVEVGGGNKVVMVRGSNDRLTEASKTTMIFSLERITDGERADGNSPISPAFDVRHNEGIAAIAKKSEALISAIRQARAGTFRRKVFSEFLSDASSSAHVIEVGTRTLTIECGPYLVLRINQGIAKEADQRYHSKPSTKSSERRSRLLSMSSVDGHLRKKRTKFELDDFTREVSAREAVHDFEKAVDTVCEWLRLRAEWTRSSENFALFRVRIFSTDADGDGPSELLATLEPCAEPCTILVTPAFGAIIPSADILRVGGEDFPGSFRTISCEQELASILCPLLCIRVLEALESAAQSSEPSLLDLDRHGFTLTVQCRRTGRHLRAKVWPEGNPERPDVSVWLDGTVVKMPALCDRLLAWKRLLRIIVTRKR